MKNASLLLSCLLCCYLLVHHPPDAMGQNVSLYRIITTDGNEFIGTLVSEAVELVVLRTEEMGEITIRRDNIKSIKEIDPDRMKGGKYWFENPHATRYLFGNNAIGLKKSEGYYQNTWIFFHNVNVGITDNVSLGGGLVPTFLLGAGSTPMWIVPKVSIPLAKDNLHLGAGGLFGGIVGEDHFGLGVVYGVLTIGDTGRNLSFGMGYGYADDRWSDSPMFNISGMLRTGRTLYLITENYVFSTGEDITGVISAAVRWAPENIAVDFGLIRPTEEVDIIGIPWLGVTLPFGR